MERKRERKSISMGIAKKDDEERGEKKPKIHLTLSNPLKYKSALKCHELLCPMDTT